ncbi:voltage-gated potassium channel subunit beta [Phytophthora cinnamomi]|uniref:voltage-gated potassium channel subunit beta n=1 Tax=Phytophthora cinnamomi TaxID=4785 RepID=UPI00355A3AB8|nr:voltage-gated potassium channel subunit beta [Phytophthora cinnamomi]
MEKQHEEGADVAKYSAAGPQRSVLGWKGSWMKLTVAVIGLAVLGLIMQSRLLMEAPDTTIIVYAKNHICKPNSVNASTLTYHSDHEYYTALKKLNHDPVPTFRVNHSWLCEEEWRDYMYFAYCLPISGRKDIPFCANADRMDLFNDRSPNSTCYASVLHMLLVEVYEELKATGNTPLITFGSLLGGVRNGSMIPFTEDTDLGYVDKLKNEHELKEALLQKGYHLFGYGIWRVCVAPTHPLAGRLYDPTLPLTRKYSVPYVDLYEMKKVNDSYWDVEEFEGSNGRAIPTDKVEPFSQVTINGVPFDTVHDPDFFLTESYGTDYMTPKPREDNSSSGSTNSTDVEML